MPRIARMIGPVQPGRASRRTDDCLCIQEVHNILPDPDAPGACDGLTVLRLQIIHHIHMLQHLNGGCLADSCRQQRLDVLAIDLDVAPAAGHIISFRILQDDQSQLLDLPCDFIESLSHRQQQVLAHNTGCISRGIVHIILRRIAWRNIRIERIDPGRQTAAAPDIGLVHQQDLQVRMLVSQRDCRKAAGCPAADDQDIGGLLYLLHVLLPSVR